MKSLGGAIASGAFWMVALKLIERGIGFVSTLILARLLIPADFGLVAIAMAVFAILELAGRFGFDQALIRLKSVDPVRFDSAWTLTVLHGLVSAVALALLAVPAASFFREPRVEHIIYVLAVVAMVQGFENIGIVLYRKEMQFRKDFNFFLAKKLIAFVCTVSLAVAFRSYWALVGGILVSRISGVVLSYVVHPYRPRFCLRASGELFRFSKWILLNGLLDYVRTRSPDFLLGRYAGPGSLGIFRISSELASLPTTELMFPIMRAAYPGYAKVAHDPQALKRSFLGVQAAVLTLTLPAAIGIVMLAEPFIRVLLGPNWMAAVPIVQVLGLHGALRVFRLTNNAVFNVLGVPYWNTVFIVLETLAAIPLFGWLVYSGASLETAVWAYLAASMTVVPIAVVTISRYLRLTWSERLRTTWRPVLATALMAGVLAMASGFFGPGGELRSSVLTLLVLVPVGVAVYASSILALWALCGRPAGPEAQFLELGRGVLQRMSWLGPRRQDR